MTEYYSEQGRLLRCGYTTGSCAAAASRAALQHLLEPDRDIEEISIRLPDGGVLEIPMLRCSRIDANRATASVLKDSGDDADVTHGIEIAATVELLTGDGSAPAVVSPETGEPAPSSEPVSQSDGQLPRAISAAVISAASEALPEIEIRGGYGVGVVTKPGLQVAVGEPAINPVPRQMIADNLWEVLGPYLASPHGRTPWTRIVVTIEAVGGAEIAKRTFNERLGIVGGISIIGTSGIVRPMSEDAFKASIHAELRQKRAQGVSQLVLVPGKHGEHFAIKEGFAADQIVHMSNFVGFSLHAAAGLGFTSVVLVGHIGKLLKLSAGIFHTHSKIADARAEILATEMALSGCSVKQIRRVYGANTTDEAAQMLREYDRLDLFQTLAQRAARRCKEHIAPHELPIDVVLYDMPGHRLGDTRLSDSLADAPVDTSASDAPAAATTDAPADTVAAPTGRTIRIVGIAGDRETTLRATDALRTAEVWIGSERQLALAVELAPQATAERIAYRTLDQMRSALDREIAAARSEIVVLASGDPSFYGIVPYLRRHYGSERIAVIPGVSSVQMLFARTGLPMHDVYKTSVHGRDADFDRLVGYERLCLLTDTKWTAFAIANAFRDRGIDRPMIVGGFLGYPEEEIVVTRTLEAADDAGLDRFQFAVVLIGEFGEVMR